MRLPIPMFHLLVSEIPAKKQKRSKTLDNGGGALMHECEKIKGFPLKVKSFQNTTTYKKHPGAVPSTPLVPRWGYEFACTSEG